MGPALAPGYLFLLDMPWPTHIQLSDYTVDGLQPFFPIMVVLKLINFLLPGWIIQKLILIFILIAAGLSTNALANILHKQYLPKKSLGRNLSMAGILSGLLAMLNPFVFERLAAGQWIVLAGYAYSPFVLYAYTKWPRSWQFWLAYVLFPIISIHFWLMTTIVGIIGLILFDRKKLLQLVSSFQLLGLFTLINNFWVISLFLGRNAAVNQLNQNNFEVFRTLGDSSVGVWGNVISLYGFWQPASSLKDEHLLWFIYGICLCLLLIAGLFYAWTYKKSSTNKILPKITMISAALCILAAVGASSTITKHVLAPFTYLPLAASLRESAKFIGILAIIVALWVPIGLHLVSSRIKFSFSKGVAVSIGVVVVMMSGMLFGLNGRLAAVDYPTGWYTARDALQSSDTLLVLPWQGYLELEFAHDTYASNPAEVFFGSQTIVSKSTGNPSLDSSNSKQISAQLEILLNKGAEAAAYKDNITPHPTRILILKTGNWERYIPLITANKDKIVFDDSSLTLIHIDK